MRATFGATVRERRNDLNLTQVGLAELVHVTQPFVSQVERGVARPSEAELPFWLNALGFAPGRHAAIAALPNAPREQSIDPVSVKRGKILHGWRSSARLSIRKLSALSGVPRDRIWAAENGLTNLRPDRVTAIARATKATGPERTEYDGLRETVTYSAVATTLHTLRDKAGISQAALGSAVGVSMHMISRWERDIVVPREADLRMLHAALYERLGRRANVLLTVAGLERYPQPAPVPEIEQFAVELERVIVSCKIPRATLAIDANLGLSPLSHYRNALYLPHPQARDQIVDVVARVMPSARKSLMASWEASRQAGMHVSPLPPRGRRTGVSSDAELGAK